jgi:integrase
MGQITDRQMSTRPSDKDIWINESAPKGHGRFTARIMPSGERLFYFRYTDSQGKRSRLPLGAYDSNGISGLTLKAARAKAGEYSLLYQSGILDLREHLESRLMQAEAQRQAETRALHASHQEEAERATVNDLFERWARVDLINRKDGGKEARRMYEKDIRPVIGHLVLEDVRKKHITEVTDALLARGVNRMAKVIFSMMRQMFRFAVDRDMLENEPSANIRKSRIGGKDVERDRVLSESEIIQLTAQLPAAHMTHMAEASIWIALSTCCRIGELLEARWEHIDLEKGTWLLPNPKNKRPHTIHLSEFSITQFKRMKTQTGAMLWVYPNTAGDGPVSSKTVTKQITDRQRDLAKGPLTGRSKYCEALRLPGGKWTPHDLRRTGATMMTILGVLPEVAERCLNHTEENKVKRIYQRYSYEKEMKEAWQVLGEKIQLLTENDAHEIIFSDSR